MVYMPALSQIVFASKGEGAWTASQIPDFKSSPATPSDLRRARVSDVADPDEACALTTHEEWWGVTGRAQVLERLVAAFGIRRGWGHCYAPVLVATGMADVWVEPSAHDWDFAPSSLIIEEAGGKASLK